MKRIIKRLVATVAFIGILAEPFAVTANAMPRLAYIYSLPVSAAVNTGNLIGTEVGHCQSRKFKIGGGIVSVESINYGNQYQATGTYATGCSLPYTKLQSVNPALAVPMANLARSIGYTPAGSFDLEIGQYTDYSGYATASRLYIPMNYEIFVCPVAGFTPAMMALFPDGTFRLLNDSEFDRSYSGSLFVDGTQKFVLHTLYPKAIYMLVYIPQ